jgi:hypothetical protein
MTSPHSLTATTPRVHLVGPATRFRSPVTSVVEKTSRLALLAVTSTVLALRFNMPTDLRIVALAGVVVLLTFVDAVPSMSRGVALTACALAGLGATWTSSSHNLTPSTDIVLSCVTTAAVLTAAWYIQCRQLPPIMSSVVVALSMSVFYEAIFNRAGGSLSYSIGALFRFVIVAATIAIATMLLVAILLSTHRPRLVYQNAPDENAYGWLLALRATLVLAFVFLVFSGLVL